MEYNLKKLYPDAKTGEFSDGWHTFDELYKHRMILFSIVCNTHKENAWKSRQHEDGSMFDDMFIVGLNTPEGQFSYHYYVEDWDQFDVPELEKAPAYDGHTSDDITRLYSLVK